MQRAAGVVAMGGYNTFCEILSFDKRAIIVPRTRPRLEQFIRARAARNLGLIEMLDADRGRDPHHMATALRQLPQQGVPSDVVVPGLLDGLGNVWRLVSKQLAHPHRGPASLEAAEAVPAAGPAANPAIVPPARAPGPDPLENSGRAFMSAELGARVAVVLKGWPRLSETFIAQEIAGLEARGVALEIWSLRRPTDKAHHPVHDRVAGRAVYLPEYLKDDPRRVFAGWLKARRLPGYAAARRKIPGRPQARPDLQPDQALGPGAGAGGRAAGHDRAALRAFPAHPGLGHALCRHDARPAVERVGARQGHLDQRAAGSDGQARRLLLAGDLHGDGAAAAEGAGAARCQGFGAPAPRLSRPRLRPPAAAAGRAAAARRVRSGRSRRHPVDRPQGREEGLRAISCRRWPSCRATCTGASNMSAPAGFPTR